MAKSSSHAGEVIHKMIFELRYERGYSFWDRGGRLTNQLLYGSHGQPWQIQKVGPDGAHLTIDDEGLSFNYGPQKLDLTQEQSIRNETLMSFSDFAVLSDEMTSLVVTGLQLSSFTRLGFRVLHLYRVETYEAMQELAQSLPALAYPGKLTAELGSSIDPSFRVVTECKNETLTIAVSTFQQNAQIPPAIYEQAGQETSKLPLNQRSALIAKERAKQMLKQFPKFGILIDLDAQIEFPPFPDSLRVTDFISRALEDFDRVKALIFRIDEAGK
jgi:hypothetical protein